MLLQVLVALLALLALVSLGTPVALPAEHRQLALQTQTVLSNTVQAGATPRKRPVSDMILEWGTYSGPFCLRKDPALTHYSTQQCVDRTRVECHLDGSWIQRFYRDNECTQEDTRSGPASSDGRCSNVYFGLWSQKRVCIFPRVDVDGKEATVDMRQ